MVEKWSTLWITFSLWSNHAATYDIFFQISRALWEPLIFFNLFFFLVVSAIHMLLTFFLLTFKFSQPRSLHEERGQSLRKRMVQANCGCVLIAMYLYYRHNRYCEPGMYSIFSIFEYGVVLTNMGYHWTSYYDFYDKTLQV